MRVGGYLRQLAGESVVYGMASAVGQVVGVVLVPLYARVFTREDLGVVALVDAAVNLLTVVALLGLDSAASRWYYDAREDAARREVVASWFWCQAGVGVLVAAVLVGLARPLSLVLAGSTEAANLIRMAAVTLPLVNVSRILSNWLRFQRRAWTAAAVMSLYSIARVTLVLLLVLVGSWRLEGIYLARMLAGGAFALAAIVLLRRWIRPREMSPQRLGAMLRFGLPLVPAAACAWAMTSVDRFILALFCPRSEVGLYDMAGRLAAGASLLFLAFQQAWGPFAYSILEDKGAERVYARVLDAFALVGGLFATAVSLFGPLGLRIMATEPYYPAASCIPPLVFMYFLAGARGIASLGSGIARRSTPVAWSVAWGAAATVGLNFLFAPIWGREGAAAATMLAGGLSTAILFAASQRHHALPYRWRVLVCSGLLGWGLVALASWFVPEVTPAGLAIRASMLLAYVPLAAVFGLLRPSHLRQLHHR